MIIIIMMIIYGSPIIYAFFGDIFTSNLGLDFKCFTLSFCLSSSMKSTTALSRFPDNDLKALHTLAANFL